MPVDFLGRLWQGVPESNLIDEIPNLYEILFFANTVFLPLYIDGAWSLVVLKNLKNIGDGNHRDNSDRILPLMLFFSSGRGDNLVNTHALGNRIRHLLNKIWRLSHPGTSLARFSKQSLPLHEPQGEPNSSSTYYLFFEVPK